MGSVTTPLLEAATKWAQKKYPQLHVSEVTEFYDAAYHSGGCYTCGPDTDYEVDIYFVDVKGKKGCVTYNDRFTSLIAELDEAADG